MTTVNDSLSWTLEILIALKLFIVPYGAYFIGIYIRNRFMPEEHAPSLKVLMLIGIPICLLVVSPILIAAKESLTTVDYAYFMTVGIIMEHGMIVHETAIARINEALNKVNSED